MLPALGVSSPARMRSSVLLPQPLLPDDGDELPGGHVEIDAAQHLELVAEALLQARMRSAGRAGPGLRRWSGSNGLRKAGRGQ
jgi:hypothetical protein